MIDKSKLEDGGSAFPTYRHVGEVGEADGGMSVLDVFAAHCMAGLLAADPAAAHSNGTAGRAYVAALLLLQEKRRRAGDADAMLAARAKAPDAEGSE